MSLAAAVMTDCRGDLEKQPVEINKKHPCLCKNFELLFLFI